MDGRSKEKNMEEELRRKEVERLTRHFPQKFAGRDAEKRLMVNKGLG